MNEGAELYWDLTERTLAVGADRSTMMGLPCVRLNGQFFASADRETGDLIVKLPASRVDELLGAGLAVSFAPAGRRFKEWAQIPDRNVSLWTDLLDEALEFAARK